MRLWKMSLMVGYPGLKKSVIVAAYSANEAVLYAESDYPQSVPGETAKVVDSIDLGPVPTEPKVVWNEL